MSGHGGRHDHWGKQPEMTSLIEAVCTQELQVCRKGHVSVKHEALFALVWPSTLPQALCLARFMGCDQSQK